jgi:hypothetical protein
MLRSREDFEGLFAGGGRLGIEAEPLDGLFENAPLGRVVVDDENALGHVLLD